MGSAGAGVMRCWLVVLLAAGAEHAPINRALGRPEAAFAEADPVDRGLAVPAEQRPDGKVPIIPMPHRARCVDPATRDVWIDRRRAPAKAPVLRIIRTLLETRLATARETATLLEAPLAPQRRGDTICRTGPGGPEVRPVEQWRPGAANARAMLPRHLKAMTSVLRPGPTNTPR